MPTFVTAFISFLQNHWAMLLEIGALTTAINQFTQRIIAPKYPSVGKIVNTVTVDFWFFLTEVGKFIGETVNKNKPPSPPADVAKTGLILLILLFLSGCSSLFHFSNGGTQAVTCDVTEAILPEIESAAALCGPFAPECAALFNTIFGDACTQAAAKGASQTDATAAGLAAVKSKSVELAAIKAKSVQ